MAALDFNWRFDWAEVKEAQKKDNTDLYREAISRWSKRRSYMQQQLVKLLEVLPPQVSPACVVGLRRWRRPPAWLGKPCAPYKASAPAPSF